MGRFIELPGVNPSGMPQLITAEVPPVGVIALFDSRDMTTPRDATWAPRNADQGASIIGCSLADMTADQVFGSDNVAGRIERTGKGGMHVILSQKSTGTLGTTTGWAARPRQAVRNWLATTTHSRYLSVWARITRPATVSNYPGCFSAATFNSSPSGNALLWGFDARTGAPYNPQLGKSVAPASWYGVAAGTPARSAVGFQSSAGAVNATTPYAAKTVKWAALGNASGDTVEPFGMGGGGGAPSYVIYRVYMEDLTVSGRTFAQADRSDDALWSTAVGPGGYLSNDTWTNPSVLP